MNNLILKVNIFKKNVAYKRYQIKILNKLLYCLLDITVNTKTKNIIKFTIKNKIGKKFLK